MMTVGELVAFIKLDRRDFDRGLDQSERKFSATGNRLSTISGKVGRVALGAAAGGIAAMASGLGAGTIAGMRFNSSIEQTTIAMGTMLGSTSKAKQLIADVTKMAAATPFEFPELADSSKRLVAYGFAQNEIIDTMTRLGDVSSALNVPLGEMADLYGKARVQGRLYTEDVMQFAGRGVPIFAALADVLGVSQGEVKALVEAGKVGFPELQKALESMTDEGSMFGGMMEKQSQSFAGQWATIKDGVVQMFGDAIKPLFTWMTKTAMPALNRALPTISTVVGRVVKGIGGVFKLLGDVFGFVENLFAGGGPDTSSFVAPVEEIIARLGEFWDVIKGPLKTAAAYLGKLLGGAFRYLKPFLVDFMRTIAKVIGHVVTLARFIKEHWGGIVSVVGPVFTILKTVIATTFKVIADIVRVVMALIRGDWSAAWDGIKRILVNVGKALVTILKELGKLLGAILKAAWGAILSVAKSAWNGIASWLGSKWRSIKETAASAFNGIKTVVGGVWDWVKDKTSGAWNSVLSTVGGFVNRIIGIINVLPGVDVKKVSWGGSSTSRGDSSTQGGGLRKGDPSGGWDALLGTGPGMGGKDDSAGHGGGLGIPGLSMPTAPKLPGILSNFLPELVKMVWAKIKKMMADIFASANTGGPGYSWAQALARKFGLTVTSTYRPGAITAAGYPSDHGVYGRAADIAGPAGMMGRLWRYLKSTARSWKQAIYGHEILNNGRLGHYAPSDHFDHVHVARNYSPVNMNRRGDDSRLPGTVSSLSASGGEKDRPTLYLDLRGAVFGDTRAGVLKVFEMAQRGAQIATPRKGALSPT